MPYLYASHLSGNYWSDDEYLEYDELYCETCNDSDDCLGWYDTEEEMEEMIEEHRTRIFYNK